MHEIYMAIINEIIYLAGIVLLILAGIFAWKGKWQYCISCAIIGVTATIAHILR